MLYNSFYFNCTSLSAEARTWKEIFNTAIFFFDEGEYAEALYNYKLLYEQDSTNADVNFRIGMCYMFLPGEEIKAVPYLNGQQKILMSITENILSIMKVPHCMPSFS